MTLEQAKNFLVKAGQTITEERRVSNDTGTMLRLDCGAVVNVWDKGSFNVQGRQKAEIETIPGKWRRCGTTSARRNQQQNLCGLRSRYWSAKPARSDASAMGPRSAIS